MTVVVPTDGLEAIPQSYEQLVFERRYSGIDKNDDHWLHPYNYLTPDDAASLLCGWDPRVPVCDATPTGRVENLKTLLSNYERDHPARRSWRDWHGVAKEIEADYHKGFDYFFDVLHRPSTDTVAVESATEVFRANNGATAATSASDAKEKKWTHEMLAELAAYRETHTMPETAEKFGISQQRIRQLLPRSEPKIKGYSAFTHRTK